MFWYIIMPTYSTGINALLPRMNNSDMIAIAEIDNAATSSNRAGQVDASHNEMFILYNLAVNMSAQDLSVNRLSIPTDVSFELNTLSTHYPDPNNLKVHVELNNSEDHVTAEKYAMNLTYSNSALSSDYANRYVIIGPNGNAINSNITLKNDTVSYYDSNLELALQLNNSTQYTTDGAWSTQFDRNYNNMNYFAAL